MRTLMIYGATGYTGRMAAESAVAAGTSIMLAGRDEAKLASMAAALNVPYRVFSLSDAETVEDGLTGVFAVLNCAGPFIRTAAILMRAAMRQRVHYLDVSAEIDSYLGAESLSEEAAGAGVMLLPGSGGSVAMLGCLAAHLAERVERPVTLNLALQVAGPMSRGSAISAAESLSGACLHRIDGQLLGREPLPFRPFDFGTGAVDCFPVTLPDLMTIWHMTRIPNIHTFVHVAGDGFPTGDLSKLPDGPTEDERIANRYHAIADITDENGRVSRIGLDTVNGYAFTALAAAEAGRRVLGGEFRPGFQTPADLFGKNFAETIADTTIVELASDEH